jgi:hypothetical protein
MQNNHTWLIELLFIVIVFFIFGYFLGISI